MTKALRTTYARILTGQITLDRAIKHIANRAGISNGSSRDLRDTLWRLDAKPGASAVVLYASGELHAVMLLEGCWDKLESERVQKINASRLKKKAGEA